MGHYADFIALGYAEQDLIVLGRLKFIGIQADFPKHGSAKRECGVEKPDPLAQGNGEISGIARRANDEAPRATFGPDFGVGTDYRAIRMFVEIRNLLDDPIGDRDIARVHANHVIVAGL
jgi:hypothetical protein